MSLNIALVTSQQQSTIFSLSTANKLVVTKVIDNDTLRDENIGLLVYNEEESSEAIDKLMSSESKFYPIVSSQQLEANSSEFDEESDFETLFGVYNKVSSRWILNNNVKTIEQLYPTVDYLADLWDTDRNSFFEELWFLLKINLASTELTIIFNDLEEAKKEGDRPKLCHSFVTGEKVPEVFPGTDKEDHLMEQYKEEFTDDFEITEFSEEKGEIVACSTIGLSPVLIMSRLPNFTRLQKSILVSLFTGIRKKTAV